VPSGQHCRQHFCPSVEYCMFLIDLAFTCGLG